MPEGEIFSIKSILLHSGEFLNRLISPFFPLIFFSLLKKLISIILLRRRNATEPKKCKKYLLERIQFWFWNGAVKTQCKKHFCPDKFLLWFFERLIIQNKMARAHLQLQSFNSCLIYLRKSNRHNHYFDVTVLFETGNETRYHASIFQSSITSFDKLTFILPPLLPNLFILPITSIATNILRVGSK